MGGLSSITTSLTEHIGPAHLLAMMPIQKLISVIIYVLLKSGLKYKVLHQWMKLIVIPGACVCV